MISKEILAGNQMECLRWSCSTPSTAITLPSVESVKDFCLCDYDDICPFYELAFTAFATDAETSDSYKNDYRKFIINPVSLNSLFSITLIESSGVEHILYSDSVAAVTTYGDAYEQGVFNTDQPYQLGYNIVWWKVAQGLGYGDYTIKTAQADFGNEITTTSHVFRVVKYDTQRANGTIKIEVDNVGVTMNGTNWTGMYTKSEPFKNMVRLNGRLLVTDPEIEIESIEDATRKDRPVQTKITDTYSISLERVPFDIGNRLISEGVVMNWVVSDYNVFNEDLRDKELIVQNTSVTNTPDYTRKTYDLTGKSNISKLNRKFI